MRDMPRIPRRSRKEAGAFPEDVRKRERSETGAASRMKNRSSQFGREDAGGEREYTSLRRHRLHSVARAVYAAPSRRRSSCGWAIYREQDSEDERRTVYSCSNRACEREEAP